VRLGNSHDLANAVGVDVQHHRTQNRRCNLPVEYSELFKITLERLILFDRTLRVGVWVSYVYLTVGIKPYRKPSSALLVDRPPEPNRHAFTRFTLSGSPRHRGLAACVTSART
jgi:hypothetical protein